MITNSKVMAIDASTKSTGVSFFDKNNKLVHYECIQIKSSDTLKRIIEMSEKIKDLYLQYQPTDIVMQDILPQDVKHNQNIYKALIYLQAIIVLQLYKFDQTIVFYHASHWRKICNIKTGRGIQRDALKAASQKLVKQKYNIDVNDDISDSICLGRAYILQNCSVF